MIPFGPEEAGLYQLAVLLRKLHLLSESKNIKGLQHMAVIAAFSYQITRGVKQVPHIVVRKASPPNSLVKVIALVIHTVAAIQNPDKRNPT